jgi:diguanylate cyclase (GGDEF)-like protein
VVETLQSLDRPVRGQFLQRFFKTVAHVDLPESLSLEYWDQILARRQELSGSLGKQISLKTAIVDVLAASNFLRLPVLMEYDELKKLQVNAATDSLTGLYNRRLFDEYFEKELNRAKRYSHHLALVLMDLHRFKEVNDKHGHMLGDQVLQMAATTMRKTLRTSDYAFRIGGDEFALLLQQTDPDQSAVLSRRLRASYESVVQPLKLDVPLALDYGVAIYPEDGETKEDLIRIADDRLYKLKTASRAPNRVIAMEPPPPQEKAAPPVATSVVVEAVGPINVRAERRKWERVSLAGTRAYAVLGDSPQRTARVLDLSYGGVALQIEKHEDMPASFSAVLHVPILPPVRVSLQKTNTLAAEDKYTRVGCAFLS